MSGLIDFGIDWIVVFQRLSPALDGIMNFFTFFGLVEAYMILIPLVYWCINRTWGFRVFLVLLLTDFVGYLFKLGLHQPRPYWVSDEVRLIGAEANDTYGIISTHASNPPAVLGYLALKARKGWLWIAAVIAPLLISSSRMYLGVHFPHDIAAGWISGLAVLFLFVKFETAVAEKLRTASTAAQVVLGLALGLAMAAISALIAAGIANSPDPASYAEYSAGARSLSHHITLAGAMAGSVIGYALMRRVASFRTDGSLAKKALRYLVGMAGLVLVLYGLDFVFDQVQAGDVVEYTLRFIRYGLTTLWAMFVAPWLFLKLKLAEAGS